jgi:hypothetical protein
MGMAVPWLMLVTVALLFYLVRDTTALLSLVTGVFLILHGLTHLGTAVAPRPDGTREVLWGFFTTDSWLLKGLGQRAMRSVGIALFVLATVGFTLAGIAELVGWGLWRALAVLSAVDSLLLLVLFWHPYLIVGVVLNLAILVFLLWAQWPPAELVGS